MEPHFFRYSPGIGGAVMTRADSARIHPTAVVSPEVVIGDHVEIGPFAVLEGPIQIGPECVIRPGAYLFGPITMGRGNMVHTGAVLGEKPQHLRFTNDPTSLEIGDYNVFRENVTIHRGTTHSMKTVIGSHNFFMVGSHVAHDCVIGNRCILTNGCLLGGHCTLDDNVILSGNSVVHQWVHIGRLALLSGISGTSKNIPPFVIQQGYNSVSGINIIGMRRAGFSQEQIEAVRHAFRLLFREALLLPVAVERIERSMGHIDVIQELLAFLRKCDKGINTMRSRGRIHEAA